MPENIKHEALYSYLLHYNHHTGNFSGIKRSNIRSYFNGDHTDTIFGKTPNEVYEKIIALEKKKKVNG